MEFYFFFSEFILAIKNKKSACADKVRQGEVARAPLLCTDEIPADRVVCNVDWRGPTRVHNGRDLPFINSFCPHLYIKPLVNFHCYVGVTGQGKAKASILIGDHSHMILSMARW